MPGFTKQHSTFLALADKYDKNVFALISKHMGAPNKVNVVSKADKSSRPDSKGPKVKATLWLPVLYWLRRGYLSHLQNNIKQ